MRRLTVTEKLLIAAARLEAEGKHPFTAEDLVVAAWAQFRDSFGLGGYLADDGLPAYPDSNRVFAEIMGTKPLRQKGLMMKTGEKLYQLTEAGRRVAASLDFAEIGPRVARASLNRKVASRLQNLLGTKALEKFRQGRVEEITFHDACGLWGISPRSSSNELQARTSEFVETIEAAKRLTRTGEASFEHGGDAFDAQDVDYLVALHETLLKKFKVELTVIQRRNER